MFAPETVEKLLRHLLRFGASRPDAEDLAQEALLIAWRERGSLDPARPLDAWLYGIARNVYRNHARRQRRSPIEPAGEDTPEPPAGNSPEPGDVLTLQRALRTLPEDQQDIVILHQLEGHTLKATAELLDIPFDTAKDRLRRARGALEAACGDHLDGAVRGEDATTRKIAGLGVATVLAGVLGAIAGSGTAAAAAGSIGAAVGSAQRGGAAAGAPSGGAIAGKVALAAVLAGGLVAGVVLDRVALGGGGRGDRVAAGPAPAVAEPADRPDPPAPRADAPAAADAPAPAPSSVPPPPDDIRAEAALIDGARAALHAGRAADTVRALDDHRRRFPRGQLAEERELLAIEAELALGEPAAARDRLARFRRDFPASMHTARIDDLARRLGP